TGEVVAPPHPLIPPGGDGGTIVMPPAPHWTYGGLGGPNLIHPDVSWGGGFSFGIQSGGQSLDLEMAVLLPVVTLEVGLRWYLSTASFFRPFLVFGTALVAEKSSSSSSSSSSDTPVFYTLNGGAGFALDFGVGAFYVEALANVVATESVPERFSVPML